MLVKNLFLLFLCLLYVSCSTISKEQCQSLDWKEVGLEHALSGVGESSLDRYKNECRDHQITIDESAYLQGHDEGAKKFCTAKRGFRWMKDCRDKVSYCRSKGLSDFYTHQKIATRACLLHTKVEVVQAKLQNLELKKSSSNLFSSEYFKISDEIYILEKELLIAKKEEEIFETEYPIF